MTKGVLERLKKGVKKFRPILEAAKARDVSEADTVIIVHDMLSEVFGWDRYNEITTEYAIKSTFCDLAVKVDGKPRYLLEVKAINSDMKEAYIRQACDYAANSGTEWVALTTASQWQVYKLKFEQPIKSQLVFEFNLLDAEPDKELFTKMFTLTKEALKKEAIEEFATRREVLDKFVIAALLRTDRILKVLRGEVRRLNRAVKPGREELLHILESDVLKRELIDDERAKDAERLTRRARGKKPKAKPEGEAAAAPPAQTSAPSQEPPAAAATAASGT